MSNRNRKPIETISGLQRKAKLKEFIELDKKLSEFRVQWNRKARDDIKVSLITHCSPGKQAPYPEWHAPDVKRWKRLKRDLAQ